MQTMNLTPTQLASLKAQMAPQDRARLRPDGLLEPVLPPLTACGGLTVPYLLRSTRGLASPMASSAPSSAAAVIQAATDDGVADEA